MQHICVCLSSRVNTSVVTTSSEVQSLPPENLRGPEGYEGIDCISKPKIFLIQILVDMEAMQDHAKAWDHKGFVELYHSPREASAAAVP